MSSRGGLLVSWPPPRFPPPPTSPFSVSQHSPRPSSPLAPPPFIEGSNANFPANGPPKASLQARAAHSISRSSLAQLVAISRLADSAKNASAGPGSSEWRSWDKGGIQCLKDEPKKVGMRLRPGHGGVRGHQPGHFLPAKQPTPKEAI